MPSRVRIQLISSGNKCSDTKALMMLQAMHTKSITAGFSDKIPVMPVVKWRRAIALYMNLKTYMHHYDPTMKLFIVRERRGERWKRPSPLISKKKQEGYHIAFGRAARYSQNAAATAPSPTAIPRGWDFIPVQEGPQERHTVVVSGTAPTSAREAVAFRWRP